MVTAMTPISVDGLRDEEFGAAGLLVDRSMRAGGGLSMAEDFPLLVGAGARSTRLVVRDGRRLIAHGAYLVREIVDGSGRTLLRLANIGAVCVAPEARGRGLGRRIIEALLEHGAGAGLDGAILWTDKPDFYARFGFAPAARERCFQLTRGAFRGSQPSSVRGAAPEDVFRLLELRHRDPLWVRRSFEEARALFRLPGSVALVTPAEGTPEAYVVIGKGLDFTDTVAEWGGDVNGVRSLLARVFQQDMADRLDVLGPAWDDRYRLAFASLGCPEVCRPLALARPLRRPDLVRWMDQAPFYVWGLDSN